MQRRFGLESVTKKGQKHESRQDNVVVVSKNHPGSAWWGV